jgi:carbamoyl-phosphate synthase large subunit
LKKIIEEFNIDCIIPGADEELVSVASRILKNPKTIAVIPNVDFIRTCLNKKELMNVLESKSISDLSYYRNKKEIEYPAIVKPIYGRGSREVHVVDNSTQLDGYFKLYNKKFNDVLVQRKVIGEEYTISVIVNNLNKIIGVVPKRVILKRGITRIAVSERNKIIDQVCKDIIKKMNPCGPFNVQLILEKNKAKIFEINPRLSTTSVLTDKAFGNEVELYIKYFDVSKVKINTKMKSNIYLFRYEENLFV